MRNSVSSAFKSFNTKFEGYLTFMYGDVKNLVTTGMGNLIDPIGAALSLPWVNTDGSPATQQQITDAWNAVKARTDLTQKGGKAYASVTTIRLTDAGIDQLIQQRLTSNEATLRSSYPGYDNWPADAQMAILSMAWAMGPAFKFPTFKSQVNADPPDFTSAATSSHMNDTANAGLVPRNAANKQLFLNAADVLKYKADPDTLYYPNPVPQTPVSTTTAHPASTTTAHPATTTTAPPPHSTTAAPAHTTTTAPAHTTTAAPAHTTTAAPAHSTTAAPAHSTTAAPAHSTTAAPAHSTTAAPAHTTTAAPAHSTTAAPAHSTTAAAHTTTAAPAHSTTAAPAASTTAAPAASTTAAPSASTTAADAAGSPGGSTTAPPGASTTASGDPPTVTASIEIDPDDGTVQNPNSYQVAESAKLKLKWSSTNADSVDIAGLGAGLAASGEQDIPTGEASYSITATGATGKSDPFDIEVHTHADGQVVSPHVDLGADVAAVISFTANKGNAAITSASIGDTITLIAIVSDATESVKINGNDADLTELPNGQKQAQVDVTIDAKSDGNFDCQAIKGGAVAQDSAQHIDIVPAPGSSTTAPPATAAPGSTTTRSPGITTTAPPATSTAAASATTTLAPGATTTQPPATTTQTAEVSAAPDETTTEAASVSAAPDTTTVAPAASTTAAPGVSTTAAPSTTTTAAEPELLNPSWTLADGSGDGSGDASGDGATEGYGHGETVSMSVDASGAEDGKTVYFEIEHSEDGQTWNWVKEVTATVSGGKASASTQLEDPDASGDGSGDASGDGANPAIDYCHFPFTASFESGTGDGNDGGTGDGNGGGSGG